MARRDAERNRARLAAAAEQVFRESGATAPLDLVAARAGLGRGTLYRHFPDREHLVAAVYARRVEALEAHAATLPAEHRLEQLVVEIAQLQLDVPGMVTAARASEGLALLADVERRTRSLLGAALDLAREQGRVRADTTLEDVVLTFAMVEGVVATEQTERVAHSVRRAVELALRGLLTQLAEPLPHPQLALPTEP